MDGYYFWREIKNYIVKYDLTFDSNCGEFIINEGFRSLEYCVTLEVEKTKLDLKIGYFADVEENEYRYFVFELFNVVFTSTLPSPQSIPPRRNPPLKRRRVM